jgi:hypothetical protein
MSVLNEHGHFPGKLSLIRPSQYQPFILEKRGSLHGAQDGMGEKGGFQDGG